MTESDPDMTDERLQRIADHLNEHAAAPITSQDIAAALNATEGPAQQFACQNCTWNGPESQLKNVGNIPSIFERVQPGEPMPAGECPSCGALCHEIEPPTIDRSSRAFRQGTAAYYRAPEMQCPYLEPSEEARNWRAAREEAQRHNES